MRESDIQNLIRAEISKYGTFFRVNTGQGWTGNEIIRLQNGDVLIKQARPFSTGVPTGFPDVFGVIPETITADMVGKRMALTTFLEIKTATGRVRPEQTNFLAKMKTLGCRAGIARSVNDAVQIILSAANG